MEDKREGQEGLRRRRGNQHSNKGFRPFNAQMLSYGAITLNEFMNKEGKYELHY